LAEKDGQLAEKDGQLAEKDGQLAEKDGQLAEKDGQLAEKDGQLRELLRSSVLSLHKAGLSPETIATSLGKDVDAIRNLLKE
jgi:DNA-directed RNA polymerase specialized sigma24 family protein